ncbi:SDR family NAD(P)-dependent oxidoreductase [Tepidicaulis sp. LMO-SS28]|uniref:SDR family NAD(P)-dependent oxidoreductase n=1 Tax=Tepidicaulis sp. LMO-SS28 TaxID=3447455 RepID=UPI003EE1E624
MTQIAGKVAVVTGAASGIGRALALGLAAKGASCLVLTDVNREGVSETAKAAEALGANAAPFVLDVSDKDAVYNFAETVARDFGGADIVINNAGVAQVAAVEELNYDDFHWVMDIDFWGMVYGTKAFLLQLQQKGAGHIVNVSSLFGLIAAPRQAAYNAAKFAIRGFTEALAHEMDGTEIKISSVHPGGIKTNIVRNARFLQGATTAERTEAASRFDQIARTTPEKAAEVILSGIARNKRRILIGTDAKLIDLLQRLRPEGYGLIFRKGLLGPKD